MSIKAFDHLVLFSLDSRIVQGNKTVTIDDLNLSGKAPPKELYNNGGICTVSKHLVNPYDSLKKAADRYLKDICISVLGGYGTSEINAEKVGQKLDAFQAEFLNLEHSLRPLFSDKQKDHREANPGFESIIQAKAPTADQFFGGMKFTWSAFKVGQCENPALQKGMADAAGSLFQTMSLEVSAAAQKVYESLLGKEKLKAGNTVIEKLSTMAQKLEGISFIDPRVTPLAGLVREAIAGIPAGEALSNDRILHLLGLCSLMRDQGSLVNAADCMLSGTKTPKDYLGLYTAHKVVAKPAIQSSLSGIDTPVVVTPPQFITPTVPAAMPFVSAAQQRPAAAPSLLF